MATASSGIADSSDEEDPVHIFELTYRAFRPRNACGNRARCPVMSIPHHRHFCDHLIGVLGLAVTPRREHGALLGLRAEGGGL